MPARLTLTVDLLARIGDGDPVEIGTIDVPIGVVPGFTPGVRGRVPVVHSTEDVTEDKQEYTP